MRRLIIKVNIVHFDNRANAASVFISNLEGQILGESRHVKIPSMSYDSSRVPHRLLRRSGANQRRGGTHLSFHRAQDGIFTEP